MSQEIVRIEPKKVNDISELEKLIPGDKLLAHLSTGLIAPIPLTYEGKLDGKYSFMESFSIPGAPVECWRNTPQEIRFRDGNPIINVKNGNWELYTILEDVNEYNKKRRLMGLEEFKE